MATDETQHDGGAPWTQRRFLTAAALLGFIAVLGVVVALTTGSDSPSATQAPPAMPGVDVDRGSTAQAQTGDSACGLPAGDQDVPTTTPADTEWELVGSMAAPTAPETHGPGRVEDGFRTCFAHSPMGALYAAVNFWATATAKDAADVYRQLGEQRNLDEAIRDVQDDRGERLDDESTFQVAGFRFVSYTPDVASIDLAFRISGDRLIRFATTMRWEDGDWKFVFPPAGEAGETLVSDLASYIRWSGV